MAPSSASLDFEFSFRTRQSAWKTLKSDPSVLHDVVIVGGGIVGAGLARQMAASGIQDVILIEKGDFGSGTSGASSKLIHAGIRYLEQSWIFVKTFRWKAALQNFLFVVHASWERKALGLMANGLIKPKPIYLVLAKDDTRSTWSVLVGVWVYYFIQIFQGQFFPFPKFFVSQRSMRNQFPELASEEVKAVLTFWDSETDDARLVIENIQDASRRGVRALNYVELISFSQNNEEVLMQIKDHESLENISLKARLMVNATGAWVDQVRAKAPLPEGQKRLVDRVAGAHMDIYPAITPHSFYITAADGRLVFVLKREEDGLIYSRIGTTERPMKDAEPSDAVKPSREEIQYLKKALKKYFPQSAVDVANLLHLDAGIRPLRIQEEVSSFRKSREHDIVVENRVVHVIGVKLTDFRRVAGEMMRKLDWAKIGIPVGSRMIVTDPLRAESLNHFYLEENMDEIIDRCMAMHWDDYVERRRGRWPHFLRKYQPERLEKNLHEMGRLRGWDDAQIEAERSRVKPI